MKNNYLHLIIFPAMKKLNYLPIFVLLIVNVFTISCTKQSAPLGTGYTPPPVDQLPGASEIGSLTDLGPH